MSAPTKHSAYTLTGSHWLLVLTLAAVFTGSHWLLHLLVLTLAAVHSLYSRSYTSLHSFLHFFCYTHWLPVFTV